MSAQRRSMPSERGSKEVWLRVYDISNGKAATWSQLVLGKKIEGVWHTGIHVFGLEYFYGGGIDCMPPQQVESSFNMEIVECQLLGYTTKTRQEFHQFLVELRDKFTPDTYDLVKWNCNHFSDTCSRFLLNDRGIPEPILYLPDTIKKTFIGDLILKFFKRLHQGHNPVASIDDPDHPRFELGSDRRRASAMRHPRRNSSVETSGSEGAHFPHYLKPPKEVVHTAIHQTHQVGPPGRELGRELAQFTGRRDVRAKSLATPSSKISAGQRLSPRLPLFLANEAHFSDPNLQTKDSNLSSNSNKASNCLAAANSFSPLLPPLATPQPVPYTLTLPAAMSVPAATVPPAAVPASRASAPHRNPLDPHGQPFNGQPMGGGVSMLAGMLIPCASPPNSHAHATAHAPAHATTASAAGSGLLQPRTIEIRREPLTLYAPALQPRRRRASAVSCRDKQPSKPPSKDPSHSRAALHPGDSTRKDRHSADNQSRQSSRSTSSRPAKSSARRASIGAKPCRGDRLLTPNGHHSMSAGSGAVCEGAGARGSGQRLQRDAVHHAAPPLMIEDELFQTNMNHLSHQYFNQYVSVSKESHTSRPPPLCVPLSYTSHPSPSLHPRSPKFVPPFHCEPMPYPFDPYSPRSQRDTRRHTPRTGRESFGSRPNSRPGTPTGDRSSGGGSRSGTPRDNHPSTPPTHIYTVGTRPSTSPSSNRTRTTSPAGTRPMTPSGTAHQQTCIQVLSGTSPKMYPLASARTLTTQPQTSQSAVHLLAPAPATPAPATSFYQGLLQGFIGRKPSLQNTARIQCPDCQGLTDKRNLMCDFCGFDFMTWSLAPG